MLSAFHIFLDIYRSKENKEIVICVHVTQSINEITSVESQMNARVATRILREHDEHTCRTYSTLITSYDQMSISICACNVCDTRIRCTQATHVHCTHVRKLCDLDAL